MYFGFTYRLLVPLFNNNLYPYQAWKKNHIGQSLTFFRDLRFFADICADFIEENQLTENKVGLIENQKKINKCL